MIGERIDIFSLRKHILSVKKTTQGCYLTRNEAINKHTQPCSDKTFFTKACNCLTPEFTKQSTNQLRQLRFSISTVPLKTEAWTSH